MIKKEAISFFKYMFYEVSLLLTFAIYSVLEKIFKTLEIGITELERCHFWATFLHLFQASIIRRVIVFRYNVNEIPKCLDIR